MLNKLNLNSYIEKHCKEHGVVMKSPESVDSFLQTLDNFMKSRKKVTKDDNF
jgi:hypothetical protein